MPVVGSGPGWGARHGPVVNAVRGTRVMRHRFIGGALLATAALLAGATAGRTQESGFPAPLNTSPNIPIPTGQTGQAGFYTSLEFMILSQTRAIGNQTVAYRGLVDSTGVITGLPGMYI